MKVVNQIDRLDLPYSITPSGFFGNSIDNIVEIENFVTEEEQKALYNFALNNKIWDITETHVDQDGVVLYDSNVWDSRVCTRHSMLQSDPDIFNLVISMTKRLKTHIDEFFNVDAEDTGPAIVRWRPGDRQEPHADKEFWVGPEKGRPNDFPWYDIASLFYFSEDYIGGELYFPQHGIEFKPKSRAAYFFPGDRFYAHGVRPVMSGNRFTVPLFWTIKEHTGQKQPPKDFVHGFHSEKYQSLFKEE